MERDGMVTDWHKVHYPARAVGQVGLIIVEATAVAPEGRISPEDLGIWSDAHIAGLKELVRLVHGQGAKIGIQLAHAGRKAGIDGTIYAPSAVPFPNMKTPEAMNPEQIARTVDNFVAAAGRAAEAGFDCLEIHAAHGYLINQFLSPLVNRRTDEYGGDARNRYRLLKQVIGGVRRVWQGPLFVRISAEEYHPDGNHIEDYVGFAAWMKEDGVDLIDVSSGAVVPYEINPYPGYQVPYAERIRRSVDIPVGAVGLITEPAQAEQILHEGQADLIFLGRELLRDPYWPRRAARELGFPLEGPRQYRRGWL